MRRTLLFFGTLLFVFAVNKTALGQGSQTVNNGAITAPINFPTTGCFYTWVNDTPGIGLPASGQGSLSSFTAANTGNTPVTATITATLVVPAAYIGNESDSTITVVNIANQQVLTTVKLTGSPNNIAVSPDGSKVYVPMGTYNVKGFATVAVIDTKTNVVTANIPLTTNVAGYVVVSPDGSKLYVSDDQDNLVTVVNTKTNQVSGTISVNSAGPLSISPDGSKLYVASISANVVTVINTVNSSSIASFPTGGSDAISSVISPDGSELYIANYVSGNVSVINTTTGGITAILPVGPTAVYMSINPVAGVIYVGSATGNENSGTLSIISIATNSITNTLNLSALPYVLCVTPDGSKLYINDTSSNFTTVIDTKTFATLTTITNGFGPFSPGNFITGGVGCSNAPLKYTITVNPAAANPPAINTGPLTGAISACAGTASVSPAIEQFTVSGSNLTGNITATAPTGFEISLSAGSGYANSVTVPETNGTAASTTVYLCSAATASPGNISGPVTLSSAGATSQSVTVTGTVNAPPTVNAVNSQTVNNGSNTTAIDFTGTASGFSWVNDTPGIGLTATGAGNIAPFAAVNTGSSPVTATITVTPLAAEYAYVSNYGSNNVSVINTTSNKVVATIPVGNGPENVSVSPDNAHVYVVNGTDNTVSVISTATNTVIATVPVGQLPQAVTVSRDSKEIYVTNISSQTVSVISAATNTVTATITGFVQPYAAAASPSQNILFVANTTGMISVINTSTNTLQQSVQVGSDPYQVVVSPDGSKAYVTNFLSNTVSVINTATYTVTNTYAVASAPSGLAISPDGNTLFVTCIFAGVVMVLDAHTGKVLQAINVNSPEGISITADGSSVYVTNDPPSPPANNTFTVSVINTSSNLVTATVPVGIYPGSLGNFIAASPGCSGSPVKFTITVEPSVNPSQIVAGPLTGNITACAGTASISPGIEQFTVSGSKLTGNITATAPAGFEVSLSPGSGYANSVTISDVNGTAANTTVYIRSAATALPGNISGALTLSSAGATTQSVTVAGVINALPSVNAVLSQTVNNGATTTAINFTGTGNTYSWVNDTPAIGLPASGTGTIPPFTASNTSGHPVTATVTVTPSSQPYAYIASTGTPGIVYAINTNTNTFAGTITVGNVPVGVAISKDGSRVYVANSFSNTVSVISTFTNLVIATIPVGKYPYSVCVSPDGSKVYVANLNDNTISVITTASNTVTATFMGIAAPSAMTISVNGAFLYVCSFDMSTVSLVNTSSGIQAASVAVSDPWEITASPDGSRMYVTTNNNTVSVINTATNTVVINIAVGQTPEGLAISPNGDVLYVSCFNAGEVDVIDTKTNSLTGTISVGGGPSSTSVAADGQSLYVISNGTSTVTVINTATDKIITTVPVAGHPISNGNFTTGGTGCYGTPVTFTITVESAPSAITAGSVTGAISACEGTASVSPNIQQFTVSTTGLAGNLTATAPTGFEVSLAPGSGYAGSITISETNAIVYVCSSPTATAGPISGNIVLAAAGTPDQDVAVTGTINAAPTVDPVPSQTVNDGTATTAINFTGTGNTYSWTNSNPAIGLAASGSGNIASFTAVNNINIPVVATITVTPFPEEFAYIANSGSNTVSVINCISNTVVANVPVGLQPYGVCLSPDGTKVYVTNELSSTVSVISTASDAVLATIPVGTFPISITANANGQYVYVVNSNSNTLLVISTATNSVTATIPLGVQSTGVALSPDGSKLYVASASANNISVINTSTNTIIATVKVGNFPEGVTVSPDGTKIYIANANDNSISVINAANNTVEGTIKVGSGPLGVCTNPGGGFLYVANSVSNNVSVISTSTNTVVATIETGSRPFGISVSSDGNKVYVTNYNANTVSVINTSSNSVSATVPVGSGPGSFGQFIGLGSTCTGSPAIFTITVEPGLISAIVIPNTFTPNGDGVNDTWDIKSLSSYPQCSVRIFNRWGQNVYTSTGYGTPWNGTYGGSPLPTGTYYYVINLNNNTAPLAGFVAIVR